MQWEFTASATSIRDYIHMQKTFLQMNKKEGKKKKSVTIPMLYWVKNQKEHFCCTYFEIDQNQAINEGRIQSMHSVAEIGSYTPWEQTESKTMQHDGCEADILS